MDSFADPQWYLDNILFVDFPDQSIQDVYYYGTSVIRTPPQKSSRGQWCILEFVCNSARYKELTRLGLPVRLQTVATIPRRIAHPVFQFILMATCFTTVQHFVP